MRYTWDYTLFYLQIGTDFYMESWMGLEPTRCQQFTGKGFGVLLEDKFP